MPDTLVDLLQAHFGIKTTWKRNPLVAQVAITVTKIVSHNPNRLGLIISNAGANAINVSPKNDVTTGTGIRLVPTGGSMTLKWDQDFELVTSEWYGIASGVASNIEVIEVTTV